MTREVDVVLPVLRVLCQTETGTLRTQEVRQRVRETIRLTPDDLAPLRNRPDQRIDQTIRNLKSHKNVPGNPFFEGWLQDVPRGYTVTDLGRRIARESSAH
ncbi:MAG: hypothetical protein HC783_01585 [Rhodobacteraceae bacterium]|nr:hypothetical protein [Paracoccaceae bacterium]